MKTIYAIRNRDTNSFYVGSTERQPKFRYEEHLKLLKRGKHKSINMQKDFNSGKCEFELIILEQMNNNDFDVYKEYFWMFKLDSVNKTSGYNSQDRMALLGIQKEGTQWQSQV